LFRKILEQLTRGGRWYYTLDQLRHRAGRKVARAQSFDVKGCLPFIFVITFLACMAGTILTQNPFNGLLVGFIALVLIVLLTLLRYRVPTRYELPMGLSLFNVDVVERWRRIYGSAPPNLLDLDTIKRLDDTTPPPAHVRAVVACPERDVLDCLRANQAPQKLNIQLVPTQEPFTPTQQATIERLQREPDLPLLLLHDASPEGCLLPHTIIQALGLRAHHTILDLGLRPAHAIEKKMLHLGRKPDKQALALLEKHQTQEKSPAADDYYHGLALSKKEVKWLKRGYYTPILDVTPVRLIKLVFDALQQVAPRSATSQPAVDPEEQAQRQAKAVGFMS